MTEELWTKVQNIMYQVVTKTIPKKKKWKKDKMVVCGSLTNSGEKKRSERQRKKESYIHLNAKFERIARREKKAFLSN